jgi:hypothetical protein
VYANFIFALCHHPEHLRAYLCDADFPSRVSREDIEQLDPSGLLDRLTASHCEGAVNSRRARFLTVMERLRTGPGVFLMGMALRYPWMPNELDTAIAECDRVLGNPNTVIVSFVVTQVSGRKPN